VSEESEARCETYRAKPCRFEDCGDRFRVHGPVASPE
jgi:hypothetical protein